jgi:hypothetical protein
LPCKIACPSLEAKTLGQQLWHKTVIPDTPQDGGNLTSLQKASMQPQLDHVLEQAAKE